MAGFIPAGVVATTKEDPFPTTGEHLDVRMRPLFGKQKGQYINPETNRSVLQNLLIGPNKIPLVQQVGGQWKWNFPITSRFGPRTAPTAGASTFHQGIDVGLSAGTPLTYKGYGTYRPDSGFGSLMTTDAQGNPYEIKLLHTKPGKQASVGSNVIPSAPELPTDAALSTVASQPESQDKRTQDIIEAFMYGTQYGKQELPKPSLKENLIAGIFQQLLTPKPSFISQYINQEPYLQGQAASTYDYLNGLF